MISPRNVMYGLSSLLLSANAAIAAAPPVVQKQGRNYVVADVDELKTYANECNASLITCQTALEKAPAPKAKPLPDCRYAFANQVSEHPEYQGLVGVRANTLTDSRLETVVNKAPHLTVRNENGTVECVGLGNKETVTVEDPERRVEVPVLSLIPPIVVGERTTAYIEDLCPADSSVRAFTANVAFNDSSQRVDKGNNMLPLKYEVSMVDAKGTFTIDPKGSVSWTPPDKCKDIVPNTEIKNWYIVSDQDNAITTTSQPVPLTITILNRPATEAQVANLGDDLKEIKNALASEVGYNADAFVGAVNGRFGFGANVGTHYATRRFEFGFGVGVLDVPSLARDSTTTQDPTNTIETLANSCSPELAAIGITDCQRTLEESTVSGRNDVSLWSVSLDASFTPYLHAGENFTLTSTGLFYDTVTFEGQSTGNQTVRTPQVRNVNTGAWENDPNQTTIITGGPAGKPHSHAVHHFGLGARVDALWHEDYRVDGLEGGPFAGIDYALADHDLNAVLGAGVGYAIGKETQFVPGLSLSLVPGGNNPTFFLNLGIRDAPSIHYDQKTEDKGGK